MRKHKQTLDSSPAKRIVRRIDAFGHGLARFGAAANCIIITGNGCERRITLTIGHAKRQTGWVRCRHIFMIRKIAMYALVKTGGKQYRVSKDDTILVERIAAEEGAEVILNDIVMLGDGDKVTIGTPKVDGAAVSATVVRQTRGPKSSFSAASAGKTIAARKAIGRI